MVTEKATRLLSSLAWNFLIRRTHLGPLVAQQLVPNYLCQWGKSCTGSCVLCCGVHKWTIWHGSCSGDQKASHTSTTAFSVGQPLTLSPSSQVTSKVVTLPTSVKMLWNPLWVPFSLPPLLWAVSLLWKSQLRMPFVSCWDTDWDPWENAPRMILS